MGDPVSRLRHLYEQLLSRHIAMVSGPEEDHQLAQAIFGLGEQVGHLRRGRHPIRMVIAGEFSTGKSSVINSLIGEQLIPVGTEPMTLAPAYFRYGDTVRINIEFTGGNFEHITPEQFQTIKHTNKQDLPERFHHIHMIHIAYPYPKLSDVHIIDTPGFNTHDNVWDDHKTHAVIEAYADVLVWVFDPERGGTTASIGVLLEEVARRVDLVGSINGVRRGRRAVQVVGLLNRTDTKGRPGSVGHILADIREHSGIERVLAYSAKNVLEAKHEDWRRDLGQIVMAPLQAGGQATLRVQQSHDLNGRPTTTTVAVLDEQGNALQSHPYKDRSVWLEPLGELEALLDEKRRQSRGVAVEAARMKWQRLRGDLERRTSELEGLAREESSRYQARLRHLIAQVNVSKERELDHVEHAQQEFRSYFARYVASNVLSLEQQGGWRITSKTQVKAQELFAALRLQLGVDLLLHRLHQLSQGDLHEQAPFRCEAIRDQAQMFQTQLQARLQALSPELKTTLDATLNVSARSTFSLLAVMADNRLPLVGAPIDIKADVAKKLFEGASLETTFHWLREIVKRYHENIKALASAELSLAEETETVLLSQFTQFRQSLDALSEEIIDDVV